MNETIQGRKRMTFTYVPESSGEKLNRLAVEHAVKFSLKYSDALIATMELHPELAKNHVRYGL